jgi:hypothetical protein
VKVVIHEAAARDLAHISTGFRKTTRKPLPAIAPATLVLLSIE